MRHLLLLLGVLVAPGTRAQHCGYDFSALVVVRPHDQADRLVDGLRITLLDSTGLPYVYGSTARYLFHSNRDAAAFGARAHAQRAPKEGCFPFAQDNYVLIVPTRRSSDGFRVLAGAG